MRFRPLFLNLPFRLLNYRLAGLWRILLPAGKFLLIPPAAIDCTGLLIAIVIAAEYNIFTEFIPAAPAG